MAERGIAIVYKGEKKNLRGRYSEGSCIVTPKGYFLLTKDGWMEMVADEENSKHDYTRGYFEYMFKLEPIKKGR